MGYVCAGFVGVSVVCVCCFVLSMPTLRGYRVPCVLCTLNEYIGSRCRAGALAPPFKDDSVLSRRVPPEVANSCCEARSRGIQQNASALQGRERHRNE